MILPAHHRSWSSSCTLLCAIEIISHTSVSKTVFVRSSAATPFDVLHFGLEASRKLGIYLWYIRTFPFLNTPFEYYIVIALHHLYGEGMKKLLPRAKNEFTRNDFQIKFEAVAPGSHEFFLRALWMENNQEFIVAEDMFCCSVRLNCQ